MFRMFPSIESADRCLAFLHRVLRGEFPCFNGTIKALRLPAAHPTALRFLRLVVPRLYSLCSLLGGRVPPPRPGVDYPVTPAGILPRRRQDLSSSWRTQMSVCTCSSTPAGLLAPDLIRSSSVAHAMTKAKAPCDLSISKLNSMAFGLAVYASQCWLPRPHARLASSRWSDATGRAFDPQGSDERFQSCFLTSSSSSPKLCLTQCHQLMGLSAHAGRSENS